MSERTTHCFRQGDTLESVAQAYAVAGTHALYFCASNYAFRLNYPDPERIQDGALIHIPVTVDEQRTALVHCSNVLDQVKRTLFNLRAQQLAFLTEPEGSISTNASDDNPILLPLIVEITRATLSAIKLLKLTDNGMSAANFMLARESLQQRPPTTYEQGFQLMTLCKRAAQDVIWLIPRVAAEGLCDMASPNFWASRVVTTTTTGGASLKSMRDENSKVIQQLVKNNLYAMDTVLRSLDTRVFNISIEMKALAQTQVEEGCEKNQPAS